MIKESEPFTVIGIHNHPHSTVPSLDDIAQVWQHKQKYGIVACHNGNLFKYRVLGEFDQSFINMLLDRLNVIIYNKTKLGSGFQSRLDDVLKSLKENNVDMEVFL